MFEKCYNEKYPQAKEDTIINEYKNLISYLIKISFKPFEKDVMNEYFYKNIEKLFFRAFEPNHANNKKRDATYGFGFDINDIIDMYILRLCLKGKYLSNDLRVLTADRNMRRNVEKFIPSSAELFEMFT